MKASLLIAWREYKQYVFSRGFILFLVLLPLLVVFGGAAFALIERSKPVRNFVVVDQTGDYSDAIASALDRQHTRTILGAWNFYIEAAIDRERHSTDDLPYPFDTSAVSNRRVRDFEEAGGVEAANRAVQPFLANTGLTFPVPKRNFEMLPVIDEIAGAQDKAAAADALRPYLTGAKAYPGAGEAALFAAIIIPQDFSLAKDAPKGEYWSQNLTDPSLQLAVSRALESSLRRAYAKDMGLEDAALEQLADIDAPLTAFRPDRATEDAELDKIDRFETAILPGALTYLLLTMIFGVGNLLLTNTIEERSNKIVEVLLSSVTADQLMTGKLIGIAGVGLTMPMIFLLAGAASSAFSIMNGGTPNEIVTTLLTSNLVPIYLFYFICAYAIFAMIFLAIGAMSNSLQDAQTFMGPLVMLVFLPVPIIPMVFQNPNGLIASILTWIPIYTPYAVMMRAAASPPMWEIIGATMLMLVFGILLARVMGRIFKNALLQSAPPKARDIWRLAKA
ncbi:MAG: ABC transporter permease [Pseudomonadota bacterium]